MNPKSINFGKFQENNYSSHKSAARENTNTYRTECIYPKDKAPKPKHTTAGCHKNVLKSHQTAPRARTVLLNLVRTHPVKFTFPHRGVLTSPVSASEVFLIFKVAFYSNHSFTFGCVAMGAIEWASPV